ncbi:D-amino-acid oxidase [Ephemerocybe angulata]|uniref:D-amino-acid oxidase n=1 Tax=Ephemerocybe angulata TaxID=980116 RepID=A0A8H6HSV9_9AGAR|nr:D-amino-acid oxidase [Tulosesus angulatus]
MSKEKEDIIVIGAGLTALMCALKAQLQNPNSQVHIIAQVLPGDPPPTAWTTGASRGYHGCVKMGFSNFEEMTISNLQELSDSQPSLYHRFQHMEYFAANEIAETRLLTVSEFQVLPLDQLPEGAKHGASFLSISFDPTKVANDILGRFLTAGGRMLRGTVRHIQEVIEAGTTAFEKATNSGEEVLRPPAAILVCVGLGARFIGGLEDTGVFPIRMQALKLRAPWIVTGQAYYNNETAPILSIVPLSNGDVLVSGEHVLNDWFGKPRRSATELLLEKAGQICPALIPHDADSKLGLRSLLVWEGCDIFAGRKNGPRLDIETFQIHGSLRRVPVIWCYGYGAAETQSFMGIAESAINLLQAAIEQARL